MLNIFHHEGNASYNYSKIDLGSRLDSAILFLPEFGQANSPCQVLVVSYFKGFISTMIVYISLVFLQFFIVNLHWMSLAHKDPWLSFAEETILYQNKSFWVFCLFFIAFSLEFYINIIMTLLFLTILTEVYWLIGSINREQLYYTNNCYELNRFFTIFQSDLITFSL